MFCVYTEIMAKDDNKTTPHFQLSPICLRLTSPNYAFMRHRLNSKRIVKEYNGFLVNHVIDEFHSQ